MPDIAMCGNKDCPAKETCYRHEASGTKPNPHGQTYAIWQPTLKGEVLECEGYWPKWGSDDAKQ